MYDLDCYFRTLGLEPGASLEQIDQAYKDLVFIWHPDRIPQDNERLLQKCQDKLKEINQAREQLRLLLGRNGRSAASPPAPTTTTSAYRPAAAYNRSQTAYQPSRPGTDMSGANLSGASLRERDLSGRNLSHANLSHADLTDAFLHNVNLHGANLYRAKLFRANLLQSNLSQANLQEANLIGADLSGADLQYANLSGAIMGTKDRFMVKMTGANLTGVIMPDGQVYKYPDA